MGLQLSSRPHIPWRYVFIVSVNLAVVKSLDSPYVCNMIGVVNIVSTFFFAHPKRQRKLEDSISITQPSSTVHKLKDLCHTRWIERIDALERFKDPSLCHALRAYLLRVLPCGHVIH